MNGIPEVARWDSYSSHLPINRFRICARLNGPDGQHAVFVLCFSVVDIVVDICRGHNSKGIALAGRRGHRPPLFLILRKGFPH